MRFAWTKSVVAASALVATSAFATLPSGTITYLKPTGTVGPNETVYVDMRFTLNQDSPPISYAEWSLPEGLDAADYPTVGRRYMSLDGNFAPFAKYTFAMLSPILACEVDYIGSCNSFTASYDWSFNHPWITGRPAISVPSFSLQPGESYDFTIVYFTPPSGGVAPGTYSFTGSGVTLQFYGEDADGEPLLWYVDVATDAGAKFTRTVAAVPEPETWALFGAGLALVAAVARQRHQR